MYLDRRRTCTVNSGSGSRSRRRASLRFPQGVRCIALLEALPHLGVLAPELRDERLLLRVPLLHLLDVDIGRLDRRGFTAVAFCSRIFFALFAVRVYSCLGTIVAVAVLAAFARGRREEVLHFLERLVDAVAAALLGDFVRRALGRQTGG